jgi:glycerol-3-phosphate dehydrogenase
MLSLRKCNDEEELRDFDRRVREMLELITADPALGEPIPGAEDYLKAEAVYAVSHEGALHLEDVLSRRTRISIEEWDGGQAAAPHVAELIAPFLGWSDEDVAREIKRYVQQVHTERGDAAPALPQETRRSRPSPASAA